MKLKFLSSEYKTLLHNPQQIKVNRRYKEAVYHRSVLFGIFIGITITVCLLTLFPLISINYQQESYESANENDDMVTLIHSSSISSSEVASSTPVIDMISNLYDNVRVLCMVFTYEDNYQTKAWWVNQTWGRRCNKLIFLANKTDTNHKIDVTVLDINESRDELWGKTKASFQHVYDHYLNDYDWFFKADDDTYAVMENLRYFLYPYPSTLPLYYGFEFQEKYMSGGAGYVLSREAVKLFVEEAINDTKHCSGMNLGVEDMEMGRCLHAINVTIGDSRDEFGRERFFPLAPDYMLNTQKDESFWYYTLSYYKQANGLACCSDTAISFHYIDGAQFYVLEYLLYHLKPVGFHFTEKQLPMKFSKYDVDSMFSRRNIGLNSID